MISYAMLHLHTSTNLTEKKRSPLALNTTEYASLFRKRLTARNPISK